MKLQVAPINVLKHTPDLCDKKPPMFAKGLEFLKQVQEILGGKGPLGISYFTWGKVMTKILSARVEEIHGAHEWEPLDFLQ